MNAAVVLQGAGVHYPTAPSPSLHDVTLGIATGRSCLVLGPSGSGKSTLLRMITGIVPQTVDAAVTGDVRVLGSDPRDVATFDLARHVAYLQQNPLDQLCLAGVLDDVAFTLENHGVPSEHIAARVRAALARVGAAHLADRPTGTLSGGEAQRVALASVLVAEPALLLLDEPTAMLDPAGAQQVGAAVATVMNDGGPTVLLVEHRLDELPTLPVDTLVIDASGSVLAHGPTADVLTTQAQAIEALGCWLPLDVRLASMPDALTEPYLPGARRVPSARCTSTPLLRARGVTVRAEAVSTPAIGAPARAAVVRQRPTLVDGVDLDLHAGTLTAILGVNGAGKSTLLKALAGLCPAEGTLTWPAHTPGPPSPRRRRIRRRDDARNQPRVGMVFQHPEHQFLRRTVREEVAHAHRAATRAADGPSVESILDRFGLRHVADADPFRLSGGQQRRLTLASACMSPDPVLLVDEPTFAQDRRSAARVARELRAMADAGRAIVVVTHDLSLAAELADEVLVMADGRMVARGAPSEVLTAATTEGFGLRLPELLRRRLATGLTVEGWALGTTRSTSVAPALQATGAHP